MSHLTTRTDSPVHDGSSHDLVNADTPRKRGSWLHGLKKKFSHSEPTLNPTDPEFDLARGNFEKLTDIYGRIRLHMNSYLSNVRGLLTTSDAVAVDLVLGMEDVNGTSLSSTLVQPSAGAQPQSAVGSGAAHLDTQQQAFHDNPAALQAYVRMLHDLKTQHAAINGERAEMLARQLDTNCLSKLNDEIQAHIAMNKRITHRHALRKDVDYYVNKVQGLRTKREATHGEKAEDPKDVEKIDRNHLKLEEVSLTYNTYNQTLIKDLQAAWANRVGILGPAMANFVAVEKELASLYHGAVSGIPGLDASLTQVTNNMTDLALERDRGLTVADKERTLAAGFNPHTMPLNALQQTTPIAPQAHATHNSFAHGGLAAAATSQTELHQPSMQQQQQQMQMQHNNSANTTYPAPSAVAPGSSSHVTSSELQHSAQQLHHVPAPHNTGAVASDTQGFQAQSGVAAYPTQNYTGAGYTAPNAVFTPADTQAMLTNTRTAPSNTPVQTGETPSHLLGRPTSPIRNPSTGVSEPLPSPTPQQAASEKLDKRADDLQAEQAKLQSKQQQLSNEQTHVAREQQQVQPPPSNPDVLASLDPFAKQQNSSVDFLTQSRTGTAGSGNPFVDDGEKVL